MWWLVLRFAVTVLDSIAHSIDVRAHSVVAENFVMTGTLQSGAKLEGTLTVDASTGRAIAAKIFVVGSQIVAFDHVQGQGSTGYAYVVRLTMAGNPLGCPSFVFGERTTPDNFLGYGGGPLGPRTAVGYCGGTVDGIVSGSLMPDPRPE